MKKRFDKAKLINLIIFLLGIILVLLGVLLKFNDIVFNILFSLGISFVSSTLVVFISQSLETPEKIKDLYAEWKIQAIYETRSQMNSFASEHLMSVRDSYDIIGFGLKTLRESKGEVLEQKYVNGLHIRILTMSPNSASLKQRELDENKQIGEIKETILKLVQWVNSLKLKYPAARGSIEIKYYDAIPLDHYCRQDEIIFVGGHQHGKESQQSITYQFAKPGLGYDFYLNYFEKLWSDNKFAKSDIEDAFL